MQANCFVLLQFARWKYGYFWGFSGMQRTSPRVRATTTGQASTSIGGREIAGGALREGQQRKRSAVQLAVLSTATMALGVGTVWPPGAIDGDAAGRGRIEGGRVGSCTFNHRLIPRFEQKGVRNGGNAAPAPSSSRQKGRVRTPREPLKAGGNQHKQEKEKAAQGGLFSFSTLS